jgi:hypothetical protein
MGSGKSYSMKEIDDTKAASADAKFEEILERVKAAGGEILEDEKAPLYTDIGTQEVEVGYERTVKFNLARNDFLLTRKVETHRLTGAGKTKSAEEMNPPRVSVSLKKKADISNDWQVVDLEDMF